MDLVWPRFLRYVPSAATSMVAPVLTCWWRWVIRRSSRSACGGNIVIHWLRDHYICASQQTTINVPVNVTGDVTLCEQGLFSGNGPEVLSFDFSGTGTLSANGHVRNHDRPHREVNRPLTDPQNSRRNMAFGLRLRVWTPTQHSEFCKAARDN